MRSKKRETRTWCAVVLASLLAFPAFCLSAPAAPRRARARAAYEAAVRLRGKLASQPDSPQLKADYEKVIRAFRAVHQADPAYGKAPVALKSVAELYAEMGQRFSSNEYYRAAVDTYRYFMAQYPYTGLSRDALLTVGEIYSTNLDIPEEARKAFQEYIDRYPRSPKAGEAREKMAQIDRLLAEREASRLAKIERRHPSTLPEVTAIRRWVGPNYSRIVINVEGEVKFESNRVPGPDRIVVDLLNTRLSSALLGKTFPVEDSFLHQIRVGQYQPAVTRVVLDVEKIEDYSVFTLPNPFRLVIDINGPASLTAAKAPAPKAAKDTLPASSGETLRATASKPGPAASASAAKSGQEAETRTETKPAGRATETAAEAAKPTSQGGEKIVTEARVPLLTSAPGEKRERVLPTTAEGAERVKPAAPTESGSRTLTRALGLKISRIVIDPGHGGHDTGTIGPTGLCEKDLVLDVSLRLKRLLETKSGAEVILTRTDDRFIPLEERTAIANEKAADLFVSIHANASRDRRARGIETYYLNFTSNPEALEVAARENATTQESVHQLQDLIKKIALTEKIEESQDFATQLQHEIHARLRRFSGEQRDRGIKKAPFVVLIGANMPSVLTEISFLTNPQDERLLKRGEHRERIAEALYRGITRYVGGLGGVKVTQQARSGDSPEGSSSPASSPTAAPNF